LEKLPICRIESTQFDDVVGKDKQRERAAQLFQINSEKPRQSQADEYAAMPFDNSKFADPTTHLTQSQREALDFWSSLEHEFNKVLKSLKDDTWPRDL
jgi:hypothetical protein